MEVMGSLNHRNPIAPPDTPAPVAKQQRKPAKPTTEPIQPPERPMFVSWSNEQEKVLALAQAGSALRKAEPIVRSHGTDIYLDVAPNNVSVRDGFSRQDYDTFRKDDQLPTQPKAVIKASMDAYKAIGIVRNIVDLMGDFSTQGIDLNHPNARIEQWYKEWFRRVNGKERSERFLNLLYRTGNVIVKRQTAKLTARVEDQMKRAQADGSPDLELNPEPKALSRVVPWRYTFHNPLSVEVLADELAVFVGADGFVFAVKVPKSLAAKVKEPKGSTEKALVARLPADVVKAIRSGSRLVPLDPAKTRAFYYKRDDWEVWASPMVSSILGDLQLLQKMKLADLAALDGAISCIRVWKLGSIEAKIMPTEVAISRLAEMLTNNVGGGVMDLVWDAAIDLLETSTDVHQFLGSTKYEPVLTSIYAGLGIPPTLTGASTGGGFSNNFISLKTLTERLQYGRDILTAFWEEEIRVVQKAMGFRFPATLVFDRMTLSDEAAEKKLLIDLADRDLISWESLIERFGETPEIEQVRLRREGRKRKDGGMPVKAGPYHTDQKHDLVKTFVNQGDITPSEVGIELEDRAEGEKSMIDRQEEMTVKTTKMQMQQQKSDQDHQFRTEKMQLKHGVHPLQQPAAPGAAKPKGTPGQGRPKNAKDGEKRKKKVVKPRTSAVFFQTMAWAENAQATIGAIAAPGYLKALGKTVDGKGKVAKQPTLRDLTDEEAEKFERFKFYVLCQHDPSADVDEKSVAAAMRGELSIPGEVAALVKETTRQHTEKTGKAPTLAEVRRYQAAAFAMWKGDFDECDDEQEGAVA